MKLYGEEKSIETERDETELEHVKNFNWLRVQIQINGKEEAKIIDTISEGVKKEFLRMKQKSSK